MKLLWQQIPSTIVSEIYGNSSFDGVVIDTEHSPFNNETLFSCIQIVKLCNKKCFVRLAHLDRIVSKMCLDAGVDGLIFSTVENGKQSKEIIDYCRYPHFGGRRGHGLVRENKWGDAPLGKHNPLLIAQIETKDGVDNLNEILQYKFDMYLIGPYDLSASLGAVGDWKNTEYKRYLEKINVIPVEQRGLHLPKESDIDSHNLEGYGFVAVGMDTTLLLSGINKLKNKVNN